jgi:nicotinamidase-related amidase
VDAALLVLHMQVAVVEQYAEEAGAVLQRCRAAIDAAHARGVAVIYGRLVYRSGRPESAPHRPSNAFTAMFDEHAPTSRLHEALGSGPDSLVVLNRRGSAFKGTDLELLLRAMGCAEVVLTGIGTGGVVLATLLEAADLDFQVTVLSDAVSDPDEEIHRVLCEKVFPRFGGRVVTVDDWIATLAD